MDQDVERGRPNGAPPRAEAASVDGQRRTHWARELSRADPDSLIPSVRRLISQIAGAPFGPLQLTSYRFPDGRHEIHLDVGPERAIRLAGVGPTPLAAAAALLVVVEREMVARRLDRWRARTSG